MVKIEQFNEQRWRWKQVEFLVTVQRLVNEGKAWPPQIEL